MAESQTEARLQTLESKLMHLEDTVEKLNQELASAQQENRVNRDALRYLYEQLKSVKSGGGTTPGNAPEPPPPHY